MTNKYKEMTDKELEELLEKGRSWLAKNTDNVLYSPQLEKFCEAWNEMDQRKKKKARLF